MHHGVYIKTITRSEKTLFQDMGTYLWMFLHSFLALLRTYLVGRVNT